MSMTDKVMHNKHPKDAPPHRNVRVEGLGGAALNKLFCKWGDICIACQRIRYTKRAKESG